MHGILAVAQGDGRLPDVVGGQRRAVALSADGHHLQPSAGGVGQRAVGPAHRRGVDGEQIAVGAQCRQRGSISLCDAPLRAVGEVHLVGLVVGIRHVVHQEAAQGPLAVVAGGKAVDQFMDADLVEQRQVFVAIAGDVGGRDIVVGEVAQQGAGHPPLGVGLALGGNVAEVVGYGLAEAERGGLAVHLRAHELEVDEQALLVLHNHGLLRRHAHVGGFAVALIVNDECKLGGHRRLNLVGQRVVAVEVALHEEGQVEFGRRPHHQRDRVEVAGFQPVAIVVGQRATEAVDHIMVCSGILGGDESVGQPTGLSGGKAVAAVGVQGESLRAFQIRLHLMTGGQFPILIGDQDVHRDVGKLVFRAVLYDECALEGLPCEHHFLRNLNLHLGADVLRVAVQGLGIGVHALYHVDVVHVAHLVDGLLHLCDIHLAGVERHGVAIVVAINRQVVAQPERVHLSYDERRQVEVEPIGTPLRHHRESSLMDALNGGSVERALVVQVGHHVDHSVHAGHKHIEGRVVLLKSRRIGQFTIVVTDVLCEVQVEGKPVEVVVAQRRFAVRSSAPAAAAMPVLQLVLHAILDFLQVRFPDLRNLGGQCAGHAACNGAHDFIKQLQVYLRHGVVAQLRIHYRPIGAFAWVRRLCLL